MEAEDLRFWKCRSGTLRHVPSESESPLQLQQSIGVFAQDLCAATA